MTDGWLRPRAMFFKHTGRSWMIISLLFWPPITGHSRKISAGRAPNGRSSSSDVMEVECWRWRCQHQKPGPVILHAETVPILICSLLRHKCSFMFYPVGLHPLPKGLSCPHDDFRKSIRLMQLASKIRKITDANKCHATLNPPGAIVCHFTSE